MPNSEIKLYAHTPKGDSGWQDLLDHSVNVAKLGREFAEVFDGEECAYLVGLLHDLGKASQEFQHYLLACHREPKRKHPTVDHKGAGTLFARGHAPGNVALPWVIAGHHGGLHDKGDLRDRLRDWKTRVPPGLEIPGLPPLPPAPELGYPAWARADWGSQELFLRLLFSALVDADALDTEEHWEPGSAELRRRAQPSIGVLADRMTAAQRVLIDRSGARSRVEDVRDGLARACLEAASLPPGLFRMTAPTGSGKTRAALSFALEHARANELRRVISVAPYLAITDQTADTYRAILGPGAILEHHSDAARHDEPEMGGEDPEALWRRLSGQTWDAPVIVTTAVQFFESLFSNRTSRCRKLHRIVKSVVILDEVQTLPTDLLAPILDMLRLLIEHAGISVVLCTATQPAFDRVTGITPLPPARELAPDPAAAFKTLKRVDYSWPAQGERKSWEEIAAEIDREPQVMAVVNTRKDALALLDQIRSDALHLSTLLCQAHRRVVTREIRERLAAGEPCRVVATQVVEAGVDLDFPIVMRAVGPLERIIQAAGRCNREGGLDGFGRMVVFDPDDGGTPAGAYRTATDVTRLLLDQEVIDPDDPEMITRYFGVLFGRTGLDRKLHETGDRRPIQQLRQDLDYATVADAFRMIDANGMTIIVPYIPPGERESPAHELRKEVMDAVRGFGRVPRRLLERMQPYTVSIFWRTAQKAISEKLAEPLTDDLAFWLGAYDPVRGIVIDGVAPNDVWIM